MMLSVCMITYNHEKYIAQAIEGVLMQKTNFDFELIIGEDCSTDKTRSICNDYKEKYPNKIKLLLNEKNLGMMPNFIQTLQTCKGKYIALCEGDDYWTDENKLQIQVSFLENHTDFTMSFHNTILEYENENRFELANNYNEDTVLTVVDLIREWNIMTTSLVFRNLLPAEYPKWFYQLKNGDYGLGLIIADKGKTYYHNYLMAVYRRHPSGVSNANWGLKARIELIKLFDNYNSYTKGKYNSPIKNIIRHNLMRIKEFYYNEKKRGLRSILRKILFLFLTISFYKAFIFYHEKKM